MESTADIDAGITDVINRMGACRYLLTRCQYLRVEGDNAKVWSALIELQAELRQALELVDQMEASSALRD